MKQLATSDRYSCHQLAGVYQSTRSFQTELHRDTYRLVIFASLSTLCLDLRLCTAVVLGRVAVDLKGSQDLPQLPSWNIHLGQILTEVRSQHGHRKGTSP